MGERTGVSTAILSELEYNHDHCTSFTFSVERLAARELDRSIFPTSDCDAAIASVAPYALAYGDTPCANQTETHNRLLHQDSGWKMTKDMS